MHVLYRCHDRHQTAPFPVSKKCIRQVCTSKHSREVEKKKRNRSVARLKSGQETTEHKLSRLFGVSPSKNSFGIDIRRPLGILKTNDIAIDEKSAAMQGKSPGSRARASLNEHNLDELEEGEVLEVAPIVKGKGRANAEESLPQSINPWK